MDEQEINKFNSMLENPITLKIFLYIKSRKSESVGVREVMRATNMKSSSTVSRHLENLDSIGLLRKLPSNRFIITSVGSSLKNFQVPVKLSASLIKRRFITIITYQISFLAAIFLSTIILIWFDKLLAAIIGLAGLLIGIILGLKHWSSIKHQINAYKENLENL